MKDFKGGCAIQAIVCAHPPPFHPEHTKWRIWIGGTRAQSRSPGPASCASGIMQPQRLLDPRKDLVCDMFILSIGVVGGRRRRCTGCRQSFILTSASGVVLLANTYTTQDTVIFRKVAAARVTLQALALAASGTSVVVDLVA